MITKELRAAVDAFVAANEENVVRDIKRLVDINSVEGTPEQGKPFGAGPAAALDELLKTGEQEEEEQLERKTEEEKEIKPEDQKKKEGK